MLYYVLNCQLASLQLVRSETRHLDPDQALGPALSGALTAAPLDMSVSGRLARDPVLWRPHETWQCLVVSLVSQLSAVITAHRINVAFAFWALK